MNKDWMKDKEKAQQLKRLLRACGLAKDSNMGWSVTNAAWQRLEKWDEEHGNDV